MALISPFGGSLLSLSLNGAKLISTENMPNPDGIFFGKLMAPWPNRLRDGRYELGSSSYQFENLDALGNLNHGLIGRRELEVAEHQADYLRLRYQFGADAGYPFDVLFTASFQLVDNGMNVELVAQNQGSTAAPFACGQHPYFLAGEKFRLSGEFTHHVITDERMLPQSIEEISGFDYREGYLDGCYFGARKVELETDDYHLEVELGENMDYFMLYRPSLEVGESLLAIEPMSAMANVFAENIESVLLDPGEEKRFSYRIRIR